jgi:hypothetical protein
MAAALSTISISACPTLQSSCCYHHHRVENSNKFVSIKCLLPSGVVAAAPVSLPFFFLKKRNPSHSVEKRGSYYCQFAKRKSSQVAVSEVEELDEDLRAGLNEVIIFSPFSFGRAEI